MLSGSVRKSQSPHKLTTSVAHEHALVSAADAFEVAIVAIAPAEPATNSRRVDMAKDSICHRLKLNRLKVKVSNKSQLHRRMLPQVTCHEHPESAIKDKDPKFEEEFLFASTSSFFLHSVVRQSGDPRRGNDASAGGI